MITVIDQSQLNFHKLDAVLPITLKDYERFTILQKSLKLFCKDLIRVCWIVTPDNEFAEIKPRISDDNYCVIPESSLIPEFNIFPKTRGWFKQQLIKMAIAEKIETDFYLTLDADVICVKPVIFSDLVKDGLAVCYMHEVDRFADWYSWAERILQLQRSGRYHNVTLTVLNKQAMLKLQQHLTKLSLLQLSQPKNISFEKNDLLLLLSMVISKLWSKKSILVKHVVSWKNYLLRNLPWTEYSVYYTFLEAMGLFEKYHIQIDHCIYSLNNSVWLKNHYSSWEPAKCFVGERDFFFCIVQSTT